MILITGGAGYIGSHCALNLMENGYNVVIFDSLDLSHFETIESLKNLKTKGSLVDFIQGDLKNFDQINYVLKKHQIDAVLHFAAYALVEESVLNPKKYYTNNIFGSLNLLNAMIENNVNKIIFSSTAATYGSAKYIPIDENHPQNPINPYGQSKLMTEKFLKDYDKAYGLKNVIFRYFNVIGADYLARTGENHTPETHLVPNILNSLFEQEKTFELYGNDYETKDGTCVRDYINVEELADAHRLALEYLLDGGDSDCFNLGTNNGNSVKEIFEMCEKITGKKIDLNLKPRRDGDPAKLIANSSKANQILGWKPKRTLEDSIFSAWNWAKELNKVNCK